jgi:hypothetical protein
LRSRSQKEAFLTIDRSLITKNVETVKAIDFAKPISVDLRKEAANVA